MEAKGNLGRERRATSWSEIEFLKLIKWNFHSQKKVGKAHKLRDFTNKLRQTNWSYCRQIRRRQDARR